MSEDNKNIIDDNCVEKYNDPQALQENDIPETAETVSEEALKESRPQKKITLSTFIISSVSIFLAAVMITFSICNSLYKEKLADALLSDVGWGSAQPFDKLNFLDRLFDAYSYYELDDEAIIDQVIKEYVRATGDEHAYYYTADEYREYLEQSAPSIVGIGVSIISGSVVIDGNRVSALGITDITRDSPAHKSGLKIGDIIISVGKPGESSSVEELGHDKALSLLRGEEGTYAEFSVIRYTESGDERIDFSVKREKIISKTVYYTVAEADPSVGIITITNFDTRTPNQFKNAVESILELGCTKVVFDLRSNPGGNAASVVATLSYFANPSDVIMSIKTKDGTEDVILAVPRTQTDESYKDCEVSAEEIGQYRNKFSKMALICNENTVSAGELFTAFMRDYELATIVGQKTHGKGSAQNLIPLAKYGYTGAIKLTTMHYFPPCGEGYDGIGIYPDENYSVELSEEAKKYALYELPQSMDDQLIAAIGSFNQ